MPSKSAFAGPWCLLLAVLLGSSACTVQRLEDDTAQALEWLRLKHGAEVRSSARWQLPRHASVVVAELAPGPDPAWLVAAQQGVDAIFPAPGGAGPAFQLLVSWPGGEHEVAAPAEASRWAIVDLDAFLPDFQGPFELQVALVRSADGALVEAARLDVSPRWFSGSAAGPDLVRTAFRRFAAQFRPAH